MFVFRHSHIHIQLYVGRYLLLCELTEVVLDTVLRGLVTRTHHGPGHREVEVTQPQHGQEVPGVEIWGQGHSITLVRDTSSTSPSFSTWRIYLGLSSGRHRPQWSQ